MRYAVHGIFTHLIPNPPPLILCPHRAPEMGQTAGIHGPIGRLRGGRADDGTVVIAMCDERIVIEQTVRTRIVGARCAFSESLWVYERRPEG